MITLSVNILPGIQKDITIQNSELIKAINLMDFENRLEFLLGIDSNFDNKKQMLAITIKQLLASELNENDLFILLSFLEHTKKQIKNKIKKV